MGYKVYYDDIWKNSDEASQICSKWGEQFDTLSKRIERLAECNKFRGTAADNIKSYFNEIHRTIAQGLSVIVKHYMVNFIAYYGGYVNNVDSGDGSRERYTTIFDDEVGNGGSVYRKVSKLIDKTEDAQARAMRVVYDIDDLVNLFSPGGNALKNDLNDALSIANQIHTRVENYESTHRNDFSDLDTLIDEINNIINSQLSNHRTSVGSYTSGGIQSMCNVEKLSYSVTNVINQVNQIVNDENFGDMANHVSSYQSVVAAEIEEEEKKSREWVKWAAIGVAIVGGVALTVVTMGGASPLVVAGVGAAVGVTTAASNAFADNYYENGSFTKGMDWSEFGKNCFIGGVTGFISGYAGAASTAMSAVKAPLESALYSVATSVAESGAEGVINTAWDVGEAVIGGKSSGEILSVLEDDVDKMMKDITVNGAQKFVGSYIGGKFGINTGDKSFLKKFGEKTVKTVASTFTESFTSTSWDVGKAFVDAESSENIGNIVKNGATTFGKKLVKNEVSAFASTVSSSLDGKIDNIDSKVGKVILKTTADTAIDTAGKAVGGIGSQTIDYFAGNKEDGEPVVDFKELWEEDLKGGRTIVQTASDKLTNNIMSADEEKAFQHKMMQKDIDRDGKVEVVSFGSGNRSVLKQDYDAAVNLAGKGDYKDKTVQDILGLSNDTDVSAKNIHVREVEIEDLSKSTRKYSKKTNATTVKVNN